MSRLSSARGGGSDACEGALSEYKSLFFVKELDSNVFKVYWPVFRSWDAVTGPVPARGYPDCLRNYYQLTDTAADIEVTAQAWLDLDLPVCRRRRRASSTSRSRPSTAS